MNYQKKWFKISVRNRSEIDEIRKLAAKRGLDMSNYIRLLVRQDAAKQRQEIPEQPGLFS